MLYIDKIVNYGIIYNIGGDKMKKINWKRIIGVFVLITLFFSIIYSVYQVIVTPDVAIIEGEKVKSDYLLMLIQCCLGMLVFWLPSVLEKTLFIEMEKYIDKLMKKV